MPTNITNKTTIDVLNNHPLFKYLTDTQKEALLDLINDKHTKFVNGGSFINKDMEEEMIGITIKNKKHRLVIMTRSKEDKWEIIKPTKNPRRPYTTDLYPHGLLENQNDRHEIRFDEKSNLVID